MKLSAKKEKRFPGALLAQIDLAGLRERRLLRHFIAICWKIVVINVVTTL